MVKRWQAFKSHFSTEKTWCRYLLAIFFVAICFLLRWVLDLYLSHDAPFVVFILAVSLSAITGGIGPGLLATFSSAFLGVYYFQFPDMVFQIAEVGEFIKLTIFLFEGVIISLFGGYYLKSRQKFKESVRKLTSSEERFKIIFENSPIPIISVGHDGKIKSVNKAWYELWSIPLNAETEEAIKSYNILEDKILKDLDYYQYFQRALEGEPVSIPLIYYDPSELMLPGRPRWIKCFAFNLRDENGRMNSVIIEYQDLTDLKSIEDRLQLAIDATQVGIWDWDLRREKIHWSHHHERIFGFSDGEFQGTYKEFLDRVHPEDRQHVAKSIHEALKNKSTYLCQFRVVWSDGSVHWIEGQGKAHYHGEIPVRMIGTVTEITDKKLSLEGLKQSERRMQLAIEAAKLGLWETNLFKDQFVWSKETFQIMGLSTSTKLNSKIFIDRIHPEDRETLLAKVSKAMDPNGPGTYSNEYRVLWPDGSVRWVQSIGYTQFLDRNGEKIADRLIGIVRDITEEKDNQIWLQKAKDEAESANRAKSQFLANMSHEIRTPLGAILGFTELLLDAHIEAKEKERYLSIIKRNGKQLLDLINDILDLSKVEAGQLKVEKVEVSLTQILDEVQSLMSLKAQEKGINFQSTVTESIPEKVMTDPTRLRQILFNLVGNAIKFTNLGSVELEVSFQKSQADLRGRLYFYIKDTGLGISSDLKEKLFAPFMQADPSTTRRFGGTGLGLILSKKLAHELGGDVTLVESQPGKGSTFALVLSFGPNEYKLIKNSSAGSNFLERKPPSHMDRRLQGIKILLAEDNLDNQILVAHILESAGAQVLVASDGKQAVQMTLKDHPDIVLMDLQMPWMDGYEALAQLRTENFHSPILALTAHTMVQERERCLKAGFTDYLSKPIDVRLLIGKIEYHYNQAKKRPSFLARPS